jgi:hypothetical protein
MRDILFRALNERTIDPDAPGEYYLVPRAFYQGLQDALTDEAFRFPPGSTLKSLDETVKAWRNVQLNVLPRTAINNFVGSTILAIQAGAGPRSFYYAAMALMGKKMRMSDGSEVDFPIPPELRQRYYDQVTSQAGQGKRRITKMLGEPTALEYGLSGVAWWMNNMRRVNGMSEDFGRLAVWYSRAAPTAARESGAARWFLAGNKLNDDARLMLNAMAKGDPEWRVLHQRWMQQSFDFLGDLHKGGSMQSKIRIAIPFWQWYAHVLKLTLWTMPVKYPGRALFLQMLGDIGDEYQRQYGLVVPWAQTYVPFFTDTIELRNQPQWVVDSIDTQAWYPQGTVAPLAAQGTSGVGLGGVRFAQNAVTPAVTNIGLVLASLGSITAGGTALEMDDRNWLTAAKDEYGNPVRNVLDREMLYYLANKAWYSLPLANDVFQAAGRASTASPINPVDRAPSDRLSLEKERLDAWGRLADPLSNWAAFLLKWGTGVKFYTKTPGPGPIYQERNKRDYDYVARQMSREENNIRKALENAIRLDQ